MIDVETGEELPRGEAPAWSVCVGGSRVRRFAGGEFGMPCVLVLKRLPEGSRHDKAVLNDILRDHESIAIEDRPAWRWKRHFSQPVLLRLQHPLLRAQHLRAEERRKQEQDDARDQRRRDSRASRDVVRMKAHAVRTSMRGRSRINAKTPANAVTAAESGNQTKICMANSPP